MTYQNTKITKCISIVSSVATTSKMDSSSLTFSHTVTTICPPWSFQLRVQDTSTALPSLKFTRAILPDFVYQFQSSSCSPINPFSTTDLVNGYEKRRGVNNNGQSEVKPQGRVTGQTQHHDRSTCKRVERGKNFNTPDDLPSVVSPDDDKEYPSFSLSTTQRTPGQLAQIQQSQRKTNRGSYRLSSWPYNQNNGDLAAGPLSISGLRQDDKTGGNLTSSDEEQSSNPRVKSNEDNIVARRPPLAYKPDPTDPAQSSHSNSIKFIPKNQRQRFIRTQNRSPSGRNGVKRPDDHEAAPRYEDPIAGSSSAFQSRLSEIAALEQETVRWERLKKIKKKSRDD